MFIPVGDNIQHRSFPIIPCVLIGINAIVFAQQIRIINQQEGNIRKIERAVENHYNTWGLVPKDVIEDGQVVGLLTHMFMHGGLMHLVGNMIVLWAFACSLEAGLGGVTLLGFYILWGLIGGLAHASTDWSSELPLVGASGAIAGLIGAYTVLYGYDAKIRCLLWLPIPALIFRPIKIDVPAIVFGLVWIGLQLWDASSDPEGMMGVAWFAHIGGFAAGAATMWLFGSDTDRELHRDADGNLTFKNTEKEQQQRAEKVARAAVGRSVHLDAIEAEVTNLCPYCKTSLSEATEVSPGLRRCGNENCARLVYDEVTFV